MNKIDAQILKLNIKEKLGRLLEFTSLPENTRKLINKTIWESQLAFEPRAKKCNKKLDKEIKYQHESPVFKEKTVKGVEDQIVNLYLNAPKKKVIFVKKKEIK